ncbi:MAG: Txe/YoeB family addiction module toxin [Bacteroidota bacterium]
MRDVTLDPAALEDIVWWVQHDRKTSLRILKLIREAAKSPFKGTGKPEPLRHELRGAWSRRITKEHRLIYTVSQSHIRVLACRYHYK